MDIEFKNGSYIKMIESEDANRPTHINFTTQHLGELAQTDNQYIWYKLCVFYYAKTEMYDRTLSNLRSPYDPTEAWVEGSVKSYSNAYALGTRNFVEYICRRLGINCRLYDFNRYHYSAQKCIDEYDRLYVRGEMDFIHTYYKDYIKEVL